MIVRAIAKLVLPVDERQDAYSYGTAIGVHVRGSADAPFALVVYAAYQCPFSLELRAIIHDLADHLGDRLRIVFRHFPIKRLHSQSTRAAEAAAAQGRFWDMHEYLHSH